VARTKRFGRLARRITALLLTGAAAMAMLLAFQERATADFLAELGRTPGLERDTGAGAAYAASSFALGEGALLLATALAILRVADRGWFGLAALLCNLAIGMGLSTLVAAHPEVRTGLPVDGLAVALISFAALAFLVAMVGFAASPTHAALKPAIPVVPPSHQAG
jgi:hypothetical protein